MSLMRPSKADAIDPIKDQSRSIGGEHTPLSAAERIELLRLMTEARLCDEREGSLFRQGRGRFHLPSAGHEGLAVLARSLRASDVIFPHYRDRALMLARGFTASDIALSYFGKAQSSGGGRQLPSHFSCRRLNVVSLASPTGLQCLPAAGAAWGMQLQGSEDVVICCMGDATLRQGEFFEALCFAAEKALPIVFVVEDNGYGISTPTKDLNPFGLAVLSRNFVVDADGRRPTGLDIAFHKCVQRCRSGGGPSVLVVDLDRLGPHASSDDHRIYRSEADIASMRARDPLVALERELIDERTLDPAAWSSQKAQLRSRVIADYDRAFASADAEDARSHVVGPETDGASTDDASQARDRPDPWTMAAAYTETVGELLERHPAIVLLGQDIADPKGGVFGLTKGLSSRFPGRVVNSPLAEATIVGVGAGLAMIGFRPIVELQFIDFVGPAFNQIANQIATLRWRSCGDWTCPITIVAPAGAYLPSGGPWHSQTNEAWFTHTPGLVVSMPATPADTAESLYQAIGSGDPVLILLPKHLLRVDQPLIDRQGSLQTARVRESGRDVTLVAWGNTAAICTHAAEILRRAAVEAEVIELCSIAPCDWAGLQRSVLKTGRLVVVQEDVRTASFGQAVIADLIADPAVWRSMFAPPILVSRPDVHVGFGEDLETAVLPQVLDVLRAVKAALEFQA
jgi:2-oxoisovalerate dehydrogenase E1 component